jgi:hypothetical protein
MNEKPTPAGIKDESVKNTHQTSSGPLLCADITIVSGLLTSCLETINNKIKKERVDKLLQYERWIEHYKDKISGNRVLSESPTFEFKHEFNTAKSLAGAGFHVLFAPKGLFKPCEKTFDVFLIRKHIVLKADLKSISSKNPDTISNRIKKGAQQASRVVVDIISDIDRKTLIDGLRSGVLRNELKEILLFYRNHFYVLPKPLIESNRIYNTIK